MPYVSARYIETTDPVSNAKTTDQQVVAVDEQDREWWIPIPWQECQVGDWLRFVEDGGTIVPYTGPETKPA